jgi:hypothetical protein
VRLAALIPFVIACSSSAKQTDESPAASSPAPAPGSAAASAASSASAPAPAPAGSSADPWSAKPRDPAADLALLRADIDIMCGAAKATGGKYFNEVGPYIAENMKTAFKLELFADFRTTPLDEIIERMRKGMAKVNVTRCDTVDVLLANDPRKRH